MNDVTAVERLKSDPSFAQWTRARSFDGFGPLGPVLVTDVIPAELAVRTSSNRYI
ncbi:MAG: fumarylacetoacetate hydrolase family protein [Betaproteobacteria bacterium]